MKYWIDTEFNEYRGELISIALACEDGEIYYAECDPQPAKYGDWVAQHVVPLLDGRRTPVKVIAKELARWFSRYPTAEVLADWPDDIRHLCDVLVTGPGEMVTVPPLSFRLIQLAAPYVSERPHHAMYDAIAIRNAQMAGAPR